MIQRLVTKNVSQVEQWKKRMTLKLSPEAPHSISHAPPGNVLLYTLESSYITHETSP